MPTFIAMLVASGAGWVVEEPLRAVAGPILSNLASLAVAAVAFYFARKLVSELRGDA